MNVRRSNQAPPPGPEHHIVRLKANQEITLLVASPSIWGFWTHWDGRQSLPCLSDKSACQGCKLGKPQRWRGYLFGVDLEQKRAIFLEVTAQAARDLEQQAPAGKPYRGLHLRFRRLNGDRSFMKVQQVTFGDYSDKVPADKDPYSVLAKLWGLGDNFDPLDRPSWPGFNG